jgi:hypothetical protein
MRTTLSSTGIGFLVMLHKWCCVIGVALAILIDCSTKFASKMMAKLIRLCFPEIRVENFYSGAGIFRFDENVEFLTHDLK